MDGYGLSGPECFPIDDLLDFSNDDLFSASTTTDHHHHLTSSNNTSISGGGGNAPNLNQSTDFTDDLCVPSDVVAELEWLSDFVDDSPAASPTFVLTQHSNSHRKVMELRRQKEMLRQGQQEEEQQQQQHHHHHHHQQLLSATNTTSRSADVIVAYVSGSQLLSSHHITSCV
ncbi:GATA transcription factor 2 [Camellia lanceoleosa]|uniref:GATA transcription factor 2 n=1 Tax=Camellia lanceoleosa TaxID=1840588 RepID=A0ACC0IJZ9_9ERIC|nr:GATA transcription factor 2 [Camellia lanceoleosa]